MPLKKSLLRPLMASLVALLLAAMPVSAQPALPNPGPMGTPIAPMAVTSSSSRVVLPSTPAVARALTIWNRGAVDAYVCLGGSTVVATTSCNLIGAGARISFGLQDPQTYLAAITASSTTTLQLYQTNGLVELGSVGTSSGGGSGTVTSVGTSGCIQGGPITTTGTVTNTQLLNVQTGTSYAVQTSDACNLVSFSNASAISVSLSQAGATGFGTGFSFDLQNTGAGVVTLTPTTSTINGAATLTVLQNQGCTITSDGTNYRVSACVAVAPSVTSLSASNGVRTSTGSAITGSGTLYADRPVNSQVGTSYAILDSDRGKLIEQTNAGAISDSIAQAGTAGSFASGWFTNIQNLGTTTITLTPTTSTINGAATYNIAAGNSATITSDGTNYFAQGGNVTTSGCATSGCTYTGQVLSAAGLVSAPAFGINSAVTGWYGSGTNSMSATCNQTLCGTFTSGGQVILGTSASTSTISNGGATPRVSLKNNASATDVDAMGVQHYRSSDSIPAVIFGAVSKSNTQGTQATVASGTQLLEIQAQGSDGTNFQKSTVTRSTVDGAVSAGVVPGRVTVATANASGTLTDAQKIDSKQHIIAMGSAPAVVAGSGATVVGNDNAGRVTVGTAPGTTVVLTFAGSWTTNAPVCSATDETTGLNLAVTSASTSAVTFTAGLLALSDKVSYSCRGFE